MHTFIYICVYFFFPNDVWRKCIFFFFTAFNREEKKGNDTWALCDVVLTSHLLGLGALGRGGVELAGGAPPRFGTRAWAWPTRLAAGWMQAAAPPILGRRSGRGGMRRRRTAADAAAVIPAHAQRPGNLSTARRKGRRRRSLPWRSI